MYNAYTIYKPKDWSDNRYTFHNLVSKMKAITLIVLFVIQFLSLQSFSAPPSNFEAAKRVAQQIHKDLGFNTLYCDCSITWTYGSSGKPDLKSCKYQIRKDPKRANRIEWEHIVPASNLSMQRECSKNGGRSACIANDPIYNAMSGNLFNLYPTVGEVNADRSNFKMTVLPSTRAQYGQCKSKVDFSQRGFEPREEVRGLIARTYFFMYDYYGLSISSQQEKILIAWDKQYPVNQQERNRDIKIAEVMGYNNPFVSGEKKWTLGYKTEGKGIKELNNTHHTEEKQQNGMSNVKGMIVANKRSRIYHLKGCPSYDSVSPNNVIEFSTEQAAIDAGFRQAKNC